VKPLRFIFTRARGGDHHVCVGFLVLIDEALLYGREAEAEAGAGEAVVGVELNLPRACARLLFRPDE
jgi:hypothetical protein